MTRFAVAVSLLVLAVAHVAMADDKPRQKDAPAPQARELRVLQQVMPNFAGVPGAGEGGCVTVQFAVKHDGFVGDVKVLEARPQALAEPVVAALKQWQFQSFPPPDLSAIQTFTFAPDAMRMPDSYVRSTLGEIGADGTLANRGCGTGGRKG